MLADVLMPKWLIDEHAITLATWALVLVTLLLVIATFVLWFDSWKKGKEQRERWAREDQQHRQDREEERARWQRDDDIRNEELRPKFTFGLQFGDASPEIALWCANLGTRSFQVEKVSARAIIDAASPNDSIENFYSHEVIRSGDRAVISLPKRMFRNVFFTADVEFAVTIQSATDKFRSDVRVYSLFAATKGRVDKISDGFHERRKVTCEVCSATGFVDPDGLTSRIDLLELLGRAQHDLSLSCPNHASPLLRSVVETDGRTKRFDKDA